jgi:3-deoxy-manno-octulosonate cytidylyltransferase (CMP-KDO synthetase)
MIAEFSSSAAFDIVTPAVRLTDDMLAEFRAHKEKAPSSGTTVTFDINHNALYFSKQIIPFVRKAGFSSVFRHIGLYGYTRSGLKRYIALPPSPLENTEGLEQLRALENGMTVRVVPVDYRGRTHASVDTPEDVAVVEQLIASEGELVSF